MYLTCACESSNEYKEELLNAAMPAIRDVRHARVHQLDGVSQATRLSFGSCLVKRGDMHQP